MTGVELLADAERSIEEDRGGDVFHSRLRLTNKGRVTFL